MVISRRIAKLISFIISFVLFVCIAVTINGKYVSARYIEHEDDTNKETVLCMDVGNAMGDNNENYMLLRDKNRNDSQNRLTELTIYINEEINDADSCEGFKSISACKVVRDIFYQRCQSDDEEHPGCILYINVK